MINILNFSDIISQTMSFTIAFTWRESIRDFVRGYCPETLIEGPIGSIVFAALLTLFIILISVFIQEISKLTKKKISSITTYEHDEDEEKSENGDED